MRSWLFESGVHTHVGCVCNILSARRRAPSLKMPPKTKKKTPTQAGAKKPKGVVPKKKKPGQQKFVLLDRDTNKLAHVAKAHWKGMAAAFPNLFYMGPEP
jgi:hypothetical protein